MIYIVLLITLYLFSLSKKNNNILFKLGVILLLILTCCRSKSIGIDTSGGYYKYYRYIENGINLWWVEPAWVIINKLCIIVGIGYQGVLALSGLLTILPSAYVINKKCENKCFGLAIYYALYLPIYSFNLMRQSIAIAFVFLAMYLYIEKKYYKSIVGIIIAVLFHNSAFLAVFVVLFLLIKPKYKHVFFMIIISLCVGVFASNRLFFLLAGKYSNSLLNTGGYAGFRNTSFIPILFVVIFDTFFLFIVFLSYKTIKDDKMFLITLLGVLVMNLTLRLGQGTRIVLYFSQAQCIFLPNYINNIDRKVNKKTIITLYVLYVTLNFLRIIGAQWHTITPYTMF